MDPADLGGVPAVMPSNDWFAGLKDFGTTLADDVTKVAIAKYTPNTPSGTMSTAAKNPPPGGGGFSPQANAVPGAQPIPFSPAQLAQKPNGDLIPGVSASTAVIAVIGITALVVLLVVLRRRR